MTRRRAEPDRPGGAQGVGARVRPKLSNGRARMVGLIRAIETRSKP
jgi:hypothetical protein